MPRRRRGMTCTSNATRTRRRIAPDTPSRSREAHTDTAFARRAFPRSHPHCCGPTPLATGNLVAQPLCPLENLWTTPLGHCREGPSILRSYIPGG